MDLTLIDLELGLGFFLRLCALCSQDEEDRRFAVKQIRDIRERLDESEIGDGSFRERITPKLDFEATTLQKLIDWEDVLNEPVLTTEIPTGNWKTHYH